MSDRREVSVLGNIERCPTCGGTGPDVIDRVCDYGGDVFEARCGSEWHDGWVACRQQLKGAVEALEHIAGHNAAELDEWGEENAAHMVEVAEAALAKLRGR